MVSTTLPSRGSIVSVHQLWYKYFTRKQVREYRIFGTLNPPSSWQLVKKSTTTIYLLLSVRDFSLWNGREWVIQSRLRSVHITGCDRLCIPSPSPSQVPKSLLQSETRFLKVYRVIKRWVRRVMLVDVSKFFIVSRLGCDLVNLVRMWPSGLRRHFVWLSRHSFRDSTIKRQNE